MNLREFRAAVRAGTYRETTSGLCSDHLHVNLVIMPRALAADFRAFCDRNPKPCPLIEETAPGVVAPPMSAPDADLRTDAPRYRVYQDGELSVEPHELGSYWRDDLVSFLLGCSFNFEAALVRAGIPVRHQDERKIVPMYVTDRDCAPAGVFQGPLVVSMRPVPEGRVAEASAISGRFPLTHGEPVHAGDPRALGIDDIMRPDYGDAVTIASGEVPVFWACGVTPQAVAQRAGLELLITHAPGHMFVTDLPAWHGALAERLL